MIEKSSYILALMKDNTSDDGEYHGYILYFRNRIHLQYSLIMENTM